MLDSADERHLLSRLNAQLPLATVLVHGVFNGVSERNAPS